MDLTLAGTRQSEWAAELWPVTLEPVGTSVTRGPQHCRGGFSIVESSESNKDSSESSTSESESDIESDRQSERSSGESDDTEEDTFRASSHATLQRWTHSGSIQEARWRRLSSAITDEYRNNLIPFYDQSKSTPVVVQEKSPSPTTAPEENLSNRSLLSSNVATLQKQMSTKSSLEFNPSPVWLRARDISQACQLVTTATAVDASCMMMSDSSVAELAGVLASGSCVVKLLNLSANRINAEGAQRLAEALEVNSTITSLSLRGNNIRSEGTMCFAKALLKNQTLTSLNLGGNAIAWPTSTNSTAHPYKGSGIQDLAEALEENSILQELILTGNGLGPEGVRRLTEAVQFSGVVNLDVRGLGTHSLVQEKELISDIRDAIESKRPKKVLTIDVSASGDIGCTTLVGEELFRIAATEDMTTLSRNAAAHTGLPKEVLRFVRPDGSVLYDPQLSCQASVSGTLFNLLSCAAEDLPSEPASVCRSEPHDHDWGNGEGRTPGKVYQWQVDWFADWEQNNAGSTGTLNSSLPDGSTVTGLTGSMQNWFNRLFRPSQA